MARRNSTSKESLSRNQARNQDGLAGSVATQPPTTRPLQTAKTNITHDSRDTHRRALHEAIETERGRLSQAQSLLECLHLALENADGSDPKSQPYYPDVLEIALTIVRESVNRLDSVYIRPLVEAV